MVKSLLFFSERNIHGGWTVYGQIGVRQYYGYTKKEAEAAYRAAARANLIVCKERKT